MDPVCKKELEAQNLTGLIPLLTKGAKTGNISSYICFKILFVHFRE